MSKKSPFTKLFEQFDAELKKQDAALDAGKDILASDEGDAEGELAALGIDKDADKPAEDGEKVYIELSKEQITKLKEILGKLVGKKGGDAAPAPALDEPALPGDEAPFGAKEEAEEVATPDGESIEITDEELAFIEELHAELEAADAGEGDLPEDNLGDLDGVSDEAPSEEPKEEPKEEEKKPEVPVAEGKKAKK